MPAQDPRRGRSTSRWPELLSRAPGWVLVGTLAVALGLTRLSKVLGRLGGHRDA